MIKLLLSIPEVDLDVLIKNNPYLLKDAVYYDNVEAVKLLLANKNINNEGRINTPLYVAISSDNTEIVKLLLDGDRIDVNNYVNEEDGSKDTLLHHAVHNSNIEILEMLYLKQADLDINKKNICNSTPLKIAITNCKTKVFEFLLKIEADRIKRRIKNISDKENKINEQIKILSHMRSIECVELFYVDEAINYFKSQFKKNDDKLKITEI